MVRLLLSQQSFSKEEARRVPAVKKVQAKAKSTQLETKRTLSRKKAAGRTKFDTTREEYKATDNLPAERVPL